MIGHQPLYVIHHLHCEHNIGYIIEVSILLDSLNRALLKPRIKSSTTVFVWPQDLVHV